MIQAELSSEILPSRFTRTELWRNKEPKRKHAYEKCVKKEGVQAIVARLRLASEFAVQTRDKKHRHYFRSCFLSFRFFHAFLISVFFLGLFSPPKLCPLK